MLRNRPGGGRQQLRNEMHNLNFPHSVAPFVFWFYDSSLYYKNMLMMEICHSSRAKLSKQEKWEPNNKVFDKFVIRVRHGMRILLPSFQPLRNLFIAELATVSASMLHSELSNDENSEKLYSVQVAHVCIYLSQESFQSILFSLTEYSVRMFIAASLFSSMLQDRKKRSWFK